MIIVMHLSDPHLHQRWMQKSGYTTAATSMHIWEVVDKKLIVIFVNIHTQFHDLQHFLWECDMGWTKSWVRPRTRGARFCQQECSLLAFLRSTTGRLHTVTLSDITPGVQYLLLLCRFLQQYHFLSGRKILRGWIVPVCCWLYSAWLRTCALY